MIHLKLRSHSDSEPVTRAALREFKSTLWHVGAFSFLISILMLVQPLYMMNLFDRVLSSYSLDTLVALTAIAVFLLAALGILEAIRARLLVRLGARFDDQVAEPVFRALMQVNLEQRTGMASLRQVDQLRGFLTSPALVGFFDLPFAPIFLGVLWMLSPTLGVVSLLGLILVVLMGLSVEWFGKRRMREGSRGAAQAIQMADGIMARADVVDAMGMSTRLRQRWHQAHQESIDEQVEVAERLGLITGAMKSVNFVFSVVLLASACFLVIEHELTPGALFATIVLAARMVMPVQQAVTAWRGMLGAREAYRALDELLQTLPPDRPQTRLPAPEGWLRVEKLVAGPPGKSEPLILKGVSFVVQPGEILGVIGPSGSGKSSLARLLVGVWRPLAGHVRLDGMEVSNWNSDERGAYVGYLPQDIGLLQGTIAENIRRFSEADDAEVVAAAEAVGLHKLILRQPQAYETPVKAMGGALSGGQRQRLGLARAIFGDPRLVVLDEPNSNLDAEGEAALIDLLKLLKVRGRTTVVIAHHPRIMQAVDRLLVLRDGKVENIGPRDQILAKMRVIPGPAGRPAKEKRLPGKGPSKVSPLEARS